MLTYNMNKRDIKKKYIFLYECIRRDIISGKLGPDQKLPSKRMLADHLNVSTLTVMNSYHQLMLEGYIYSRERKGYFVQKLDHVPRNAGVRNSHRDSRTTETQSSEDRDVIDSKANRTSLSIFPFGIWKRFMREALSLDNDSLLRPVPYNGLKELRLSISGFLSDRNGMDVDPEQIIIGSGTEYLYSKLLQLLDRDKILALENPGYMKLSKIAENYGRECVFIDIDDEGLNVSDLENSGADIVHLSPSNNFPTGMIMPVARRFEILNWANAAEGRFIIEDDYDSEFRYSGKHILPMFVNDDNDKVIYMNTFSKTMIPSIRISYMILPFDLLEKYRENLSFYACTVSSFEQYALSLFIDNGHLDRHLNRLKKYYREQRRAILEAFEESEIRDVIRVYEQNSGTHFLISIENGVSEKLLYERGKEEKLILSFLSEYTYDYYDNRSKAVLVFNYASIEKDKINEVVEKLTRIITGRPAISED